MKAVVAGLLLCAVTVHAQFKLSELVGTWEGTCQVPYARPSSEDSPNTCVPAGNTIERSQVITYRDDGTLEYRLGAASKVIAGTTYFVRAADGDLEYTADPIRGKVSEGVGNCTTICGDCYFVRIAGGVMTERGQLNLGSGDASPCVGDTIPSGNLPCTPTGSIIAAQYECTMRRQGASSGARGGASAVGVGVVAVLGLALARLAAL